MLYDARRSGSWFEVRGCTYGTSSLRYDDYNYARDLGSTTILPLWRDTVRDMSSIISPKFQSLAHSDRLLILDRTLSKLLSDFCQIASDVHFSDNTFLFTKPRTESSCPWAPVKIGSSCVVQAPLIRIPRFRRYRKTHFGLLEVISPVSNLFLSLRQSWHNRTSRCDFK